ncbi:hypothetical protein VNO77_27857 [Canavalia gladiata]|uniref:Pectinesterase inhibitor domain-containing protein n=1 Tax=Canavalia gladiata TaxID=3824 RepID=A0AAN9KYL8_CANGL
MNMAFFSNMPRVIVALLLLILSPSLFTHQSKNLAIADSKLVQTLCYNSESPETCIRCVQSSKCAEKADSVGIARIIVNCINDKAKTLALNMKILASTSSGNLKEFYQRCANDYNRIAKKELISAKKALHNHKYDQAEYCVVKALSFDAACHKNLKGDFNDKVSKGVLYEMKIYEELSEAACRIIEKLYVRG